MVLSHIVFLDPEYIPDCNGKIKLEKLTIFLPVIKPVFKDTKAFWTDDSPFSHWFSHAWAKAKFINYNSVVECSLLKSE